MIRTIQVIEQNSLCYSYSQWLSEVRKDLSIQVTNITLLQSLKIRSNRVRLIAKKSTFYFLAFLNPKWKTSVTKQSHPPNYQWSKLQGPRAQGMSLLSAILHETRKRPGMKHFLHKVGSFSGRVWPMAGATETSAAQGPAVGRQKTSAHREW